MKTDGQAVDTCGTHNTAHSVSGVQQGLTSSAACRYTNTALQHSAPLIHAMSSDSTSSRKHTACAACLMARMLLPSVQTALTREGGVHMRYSAPHPALTTSVCLSQYSLTIQQVGLASAGLISATAVVNAAAAAHHAARGTQHRTHVSAYVTASAYDVKHAHTAVRHSSTATHHMCTVQRCTRQGAALHIDTAPGSGCARIIIHSSPLKD